MNIQGISSLITAPTLGQSAISPRPASSTGSTGSTSNTGSTSSATGTSASSLQTMFLNLLVTELQNQDPTQPVDPTEMVGQMISLNQLDQLISINQALSSITGTSTSTGSTPTQASTAPSTSSTASTANSTQPLAFQPQPETSGVTSNGSITNLYNMYGNSGALATAVNHFTAIGGK